MAAHPVSDEFDRARLRSQEMEQPMFLYWGTKWCPPCAEMQMTVFQRPLFEARSANFIMASVDGDASGAQLCSDRLDCEVYPTMLVLGADEREWIRMPCGLKEDVFCGVIDAAVRRRVPMAALADALLRRETPLQTDELTLLAYHYWPQDRRIFPGTARLALLDRLDAALKLHDARTASRVLIWQLAERSIRPSGETPAPSAQTFLHRFLALLQSPEATFSTLYYVLVNLEPTIALLCENDVARRRGLMEALIGVLDRLLTQDALTWTERLIAQSARLSLEPDTPRNEIEALVMQADAAATSATERQSVMNMAGHLLRQCGLREASIRLFRAEVDRSPWPTYFMPYIAEMYMEQDDREEAFRWWRRAYEETPGKTTRFELGVRYIAAVARHAPAERAVIETTVTRLFAERGEDADTGRGRMRKALGLLARTLKEWQP